MADKQASQGGHERSALLAGSVAGAEERLCGRMCRLLTHPLANAKTGSVQVGTSKLVLILLLSQWHNHLPGKTLEVDW